MTCWSSKGKSPKLIIAFRLVQSKMSKLMFLLLSRQKSILPSLTSTRSQIKLEFHRARQAFVDGSVMAHRPSVETDFIPFNHWTSSVSKMLGLLSTTPATFSGSWLIGHQYSVIIHYVTLTSHQRPYHRRFYKSLSRRNWLSDVYSPPITLNDCLLHQHLVINFEGK